MVKNLHASLSKKAPRKRKSHHYSYYMFSFLAEQRLDNGSIPLSEPHGTNLQLPRCHVAL